MLRRYRRAGRGNHPLTNGEWQPFLSKDAPHHGLASHIVIEAFALVGVEVEYGFFPWKRSFKLAKEGTWDGSVVWGTGEERQQHFYFTDPVVPITFYVLPSQDHSVRLEQL